MSQLFSPFTLRGLTIPNRVFVSPMCQYSCADDGLVTPWHLVHLGSRAVGGAGLVMVEASAVSPAGRITPRDVGIWSADHAEALAPVVAFIREQGSVAAIQLAHAGRKASTRPPFQGGTPVSVAEGGWVPLGASAVPFSPAHTTPQAMDTNDIDQLVDDFVAAARHSLAAGFEVAELHMAHGYLLHSFLSPLSNRREDDYGGSLDNRMRLPLRVAEAVRAVWPEELPLFVRISATDWVEGGWDLAQSIVLAERLKALGVDFIDCSSAALVPDAQIPVAPGFQVPFAQAIRREVGIATGAVGLITEAVQAEQILVTGQADAVLLARELLRDPYWPLHAAQELAEDVPWPLQYERAKPRR